MNKPSLATTLWSISHLTMGIRKARFAFLGAVFLAGSMLCGGIASAQNTVDTISSSQSDLTVAATYSSSPSLPGTTSDVEWTNQTYSPIAFTLTSGNALSIGTLDDLDATQALTVADANGAAATITLNGGSNQVAPSTSDLLYVASGGTLTLTGGSGTTALGLALAASGNFDIAGAANIGSIISGGYAITKTGTGTLTLSGLNTYSAGTTLSAGTLAISGVGTATGSAGSYTVTNGALGTGTLTFSGGTLATTGTLNVAIYNNISTSGTDAINISSLTSGTSLTLNGNLSGNGNITQTGPSSSNAIVVLSGNNSSFTGTYSLTANTANIIHFDNANAGSASAAWVLNTGSNRAGTIQLDNVAGSTIYFGSLAGTTGGGTTSLRSGTSGTTTISVGALGASTTFATPIAINGSDNIALTVTGGDLTLTGANTYTGATTITSGTLTLGTGGSFATTSAITDNGTFAINSTGTVVEGTAFASTFGGTGGAFLQQGSGTTTLSGTNSYTGATTVENGTLLAGAAAPSGSSGAFGNTTSAIALGDATSITSNLSPSLLTGGAYTVALPITVGASNTATSGVYTIGGSTANTSTFSGTITLNQGLTVSQVASGTLDLTGNITSGASGTQTLKFNNVGAVSQSANVIGGGTGTIAVTQAGSGTTTLSGANTYTGATTVSAGTLQAGVASVANVSGAFGDNSAVTLANVAGATLDLNGNNTQVGSLTGGGTTGGNITLEAATLTVGGDNTSPAAYEGNISSTGTPTISLVKIGTGTLTLTGTNTFTGGLAINNGAVSTSANNGLGAIGSAVTVGSGSNNATLAFFGNVTNTEQDFVIAGTGTDTITSSAASGSGATFDNGAGTFQLQNNLIVNETSTGGISFRAAISQSGGTYGITIGPSGANTGSVEFQGANTFGGTVAIDSGSADVSHSSSVGTVGSITSGPLGTGAVTLGQSGSSSAATLGLEIGNTSPFGISILNAITVESGSGGRTISALSALPSSSADIVSGPITLDADLTLTAVSSNPTTLTGVDRLQVGAGGITGNNNIIINNSNTLTGAVVGSGAIALYGGSSATGWTGNLIAQAGQGALGNANAIGKNNTLAVASGAVFNFSDNTTAFSPTVAGLDNATSAGAIGGSTGGTVLNNSGTNETLTLGGSGAYTFAGTITDGSTKTTALTVALTSSGSQNLSGSNTYTGGTTVNGGVLLANNTAGSAFGTAAVATGNSSGTIGGGNGASNSNAPSGTAAGTLTTYGTGVNAGTYQNYAQGVVGIIGAGVTINSGGTLAPGNGGTVGTLTVNSGGLTLNSSATLTYYFNATNSSNSYVDVTGGALTLNSTAGAYTVNLYQENGTTAFSPTGAGVYNLIGYNSTGGVSNFNAAAFAVPSGEQASGYTYTIVNDTTDDIIQLDVSAASVPEPSTWTLLLGGLTLMLFWQRRRVSASPVS